MNRFLLFSFVLLLLITGCSASRSSGNSSSIKQKLESQYNLYQGTHYKYGGKDQKGFDCSGFTQKVYENAFNIKLPRTSVEMTKIGKKVSKNKLKPGDLVFFRPSRKYWHVGIYIENKQFIHSSTSKGVIKSNLDSPYWEKKYKFAKRILKTKQ